MFDCDRRLVFFFLFFITFMLPPVRWRFFQNYSWFFSPLSKLNCRHPCVSLGVRRRKHRTPIQTHCRPVDQWVPCVRIGKQGDGVIVHLLWPGGRSLSAHVHGGWPDLFGYEWVGLFATSGPPTSRGVSSYERFPREVVGKYLPISGWSPLVAQGIPVGFPILLVTNGDLLPRCLQWRLHLKYDGSSCACKGATVWNMTDISLSLLFFLRLQRR